MAIAVNTNHELTAVQNTSNPNVNVIDSKHKFTGKLIIVPNAVSVMDSFHACLFTAFMTLLVDQTNQFVPARLVDSISNSQTHKISR